MSDAPGGAAGRVGGWRRALGVLVGVTVSIIGVIFFFRSVPLGDMLAAIASIHPGWVVAAFALTLADYALRSWRWSLMLSQEKPGLSVRACAGPLFASVAINNLAPFRLGDVARSVVFPPMIGVTRTFATATLLLERLLDLVAVLALLACGLLLVGPRIESDLLERTAIVGSAFAATGVVGVALAIFLAPGLQRLGARLSGRDGLVGRVGDIVEMVFGRVSLFRSRRLWAALVVASAGCWVLEASVFWAILRGLEPAAGAAEAAVLGAIGTLSTLVPSTPGYVGTFHLAVQQSAAVLGLSAAVGSATAILAHAALWVTTTAGGLAAMANMGLSTVARLFGAGRASTSSSA